MGQLTLGMRFLLLISLSFTIFCPLAFANNRSEYVALGEPSDDREIFRTETESDYTWEDYKKCRTCWEKKADEEPPFGGCGSWCRSMRLLVD